MTGIYKISNHLNECYIDSSHNIEKRSINNIEKEYRKRLKNKER